MYFVTGLISGAIGCLLAYVLIKAYEFNDSRVSPCNIDGNVAVNIRYKKDANINLGDQWEKEFAIKRIAQKSFYKSLENDNIEPYDYFRDHVISEIKTEGIEYIGVTFPAYVKKGKLHKTKIGGFRPDMLYIL